MFFDTHAHYDDERFNEDRDEIINNAFQSGVTYILNASSSMASAIDSITLSQEYSFIYAAVGVHPHHASDINEGAILTLADFTSSEKVVAIGEIGLDYYYDNSPREQQRHWFTRQIDLAKNLKLPIIVHDRDAHEDVMNIIKKTNARQVGGVFHCFSGSVEMAQEALKNNFYISIGGPVTFKNVKKAVEVVKWVPLERLLIETDCPYLTPEPNRGKRNDSSYVRLVAEKIAEIRGMDVEEIGAVTTKNAMELFGIA